MSAMAFLAGMGAGYLSAKDKKLEQDRQAAQEKRQQDAFQMQKVTFDQNQANNATLRAAGAPVEVTPEQGPPTEAQYAATPAGQEPDAIGYRVGNGFGAKDFATRGLAETAATQQNTSQGTQARQIAAMQGIGDFAGAQKLRSETAKATSEEQTLAESITARSIQALPSFEHVGQYISDSPANNQNGSFKGKFIVSPDGAVQTFNVVNSDGTLTPTQRTFPNTPQGLESAKNALTGAMTPEQRRIQAQHDITNGLAAKKEEREALEGKSRASYYDAYAEALRPGGTKDKSGSAVDRMTEIDKTTLVNINKQRDTIHAAIVKAQAEENYDPTKPGAKELTEQLAALGIKEAQIQSKYGDAQATPDPQGLRKPAPAASESKLRAQAAGNMGADPKAIQREIDAATADLKKVTDPGSKEQLQTHINDLKRQAGNLPADTQAAAIATRPAPTPREIAATRGSSPVTGAPTLAPSAPAMASRGVQAPAPSYDQWMAAKNARDQLISNANQMSPESRDLYLRSRLPQIEQAIAFNQNYKKY